MLYLVLLMPGSASAHAYLEESNPESNAIIATPPPEVVLRFTEPLERSYSMAELYDHDGNLIPGAASSAGDDEYSMVLDLPANLPNGTYSVIWRTLSTADGHTAQNYVPFTIGTADDVDLDVAVVDHIDGSHETGWLTTFARWLALLGLAAALAAWPMWLFVLRPAIAPIWRVGPDFTRRMRRYTVVAVVTALLGSLFALFVQAANLTDENFLDRLRITLGDTRYGSLWYIRIGLLFGYGLLLQWVAWWWPRHRPMLLTTTLLIALALPIPFSLISHASAQTLGRSTAILNDVMHLLSASLWVGGLLAIVVVLLPTMRNLSPADRRLVLSRALPRFSVIALAAWATLALTGFYNAWLQVGNFDALVNTDYGRSLTLKLIIIVPILILAAFNLFVVTGRLQRLAHTDTASSAWPRRFALAVGTEVVLAIAVLMVVGILTGQAPAREAIAQQTDDVTVEFSGEDGQATLSLEPGTAGPNRFALDISGNPLADETDVLLRVEMPDQDTGEKEIQLTRGDANTFSHQGSELSISGDWDFTLIVRPPDENEWRSSGSQMIVTEGTGTDSPAPAWRFSGFGGGAGLLLIVAGFAGVVYASLRSPTRYKPLVGGLAVFAVAIGIAVLVFARIDAQDVAREEPRHSDHEEPHEHLD